MGYQALLFCPDEKTARAVTQVLSELDFTVTPSTEPFGAVKKLMAEHFDAVVVDCDNEQNATLLFKSARNTPNNQSALAVAVVEGQAGVAKAFRIGANLVLTKPINVEQAKGTLRVARGLLRKNEGGKPAAPTASTAAKPAPAPSNPAPQVPSTKVVAARPPAPPAAPPVKAAAASIPAQKPPQPRVVASVPADNESDAEILDIDEIVSPATAAPGTKITASESDILSPTPTMGASRASSGGFGSSAASAPAPAREAKPATVISEPESPAGKVAASGESSSSNDEASAPAPAFTFGGNVATNGEPARGGSKKALLVAAAVVIVAAGGYALWMQWIRSSGAAAPFAHVATPVTKPAVVPKVAPSTAPAGSPSAASSATVPATSSATSSVPSSGSDSAAVPKGTGTVKTSSDSDEPDAESGDEPVHGSKGATKADSAKSSVSAPAANKAPATKAAVTAAPIVIKSGNSQATAKPAPTPDAPSITGIAAADNGASLPNLMGGNSPAPAPVLQTLNVSQGVSRGLLVKKTQPVYPASAMQMHIEGAVELLATISKEGNISAVKIVSGDARLARAAVDAVKQWKYKPYLLNGEPVEIQTQVTMNFKLPN
jgi:TonB family protein